MLTAAVVFFSSFTSIIKDGQKWKAVILFSSQLHILSKDELHIYKETVNVA